ncbi:MAG TPA: hypothetical protein DGK99_03900 [Acidimicrobiaceae bacterium]|nr:hypothetical protein [Acidimicrobiaceae bacterium]
MGDRPEWHTSAMAWCFQCGNEYAPGVEDCVECGVALVSEPPADAAEVGALDEDQLAYELHEWAGESRRILDQDLTAAGIAHAWQGATLVVRVADEETVDRAIEDAEDAGGPAIEPGVETVAYEVGGWAADEQSAFSDLLVRLGVPHEFDAEGDLVVRAADEDAVEVALDAFEAEADDRPELEGLDANGLLSDVFVACDRLRRDARDLAGIEGLANLAPVLVGHRPPFGIDGRMWNALGERTMGLVGLLGTGDPEPAEVSAVAGELAEVLRHLT